MWLECEIRTSINVTKAKQLCGSPKIYLKTATGCAICTPGNVVFVCFYYYQIRIMLNRTRECTEAEQCFFL